MTDKEFSDFWEQQRLEKKKKTRKAILILLACIAGFILFTFTVAIIALLSSDAYKVASQEIRNNKAVLTAIGGVENVGWPSGSVSTHNDSGEALLNISVNGKSNDADVTVELVKQMAPGMSLR